MYKYIIGLIIIFSFIGCGEGIVEIDSKLYEPRVVIYGFIEPGKPVKDTSISRNFPLNQKVNQDSLYLSEADVILTDLELNKSYKLTFNTETKTFERLDVIIKKGISYKLSITAAIDGNKVEVSAVTSVPIGTPEIDTLRSKLESFNIFDKDENGKYKYFEVCWKFSSDVDCYVFSKYTSKMDQSTRVWGMPFDAYNELRAKYGSNYYSKIYNTTDFIYNEGRQNSYYYHKLEPYLFGYHGIQRFIVTGGDMNFKDYITKPKEVTDVDGNQFEPKYHISGAGIGVFGSMSSDTVEVMLYKRDSYGDIIVTL